VEVGRLYTTYGVPGPRALAIRPIVDDYSGSGTRDKASYMRRPRDDKSSPLDILVTVAFQQSIYSIVGCLQMSEADVTTDERRTDPGWRKIRSGDRSTSGWNS
jgi:hypothetical protein